MAVVLDGKKLALEIREKIRVETQELKEHRGVTPGLAVVLVGDDPASAVYVRNKDTACRKAGFHSVVCRMDARTTKEELIEKIGQLNRDESIHGILAQLPLPGHLDELEIIGAVDPQKDVDGLHTCSAGALLTGQKGFIPCTPRGIMRLIDESGIELSGKNAVVVGRSNIVGKPAALLLLAQHATVTVCHSRTEHLADVTRNADILVAAVGIPGFITGDMVKPGAVVIDVGINRSEEGKLVGDVDYQGAEKVAGFITPVPGGVGPMTIAMLLQNTLESARGQ
ncbi:MAG: bifunctional methylenetetrahydrofolate dehydrogenase/methenyltetrahydrofolate cyclohydrolase FolD [Christensenellales bacterium]|jgi:methylenetetrahydrofolate dehydrogenase (NADP+)/methenyltetrahydrofolate cyclohydrolase